MTGYIIENKNDGTNAFSDDPDQHFDSLEQAKDWADALWESIMDCVGKDDDMPQKSDYIVAYYKDGVQCGEWPLFED